MITVLVIFGIIIVGLWFYMKRTSPHTSVDEDDKKRVKLQERLQSESTKRELAEHDELAAIQQKIKDVDKPVEPMVSYDAAAYEKTRETDDATRMKNIKEAMGVDDTVHTPTEVKKRSDARNAQLQWQQLSENNDIYDNKGYDKKTGKLTWIFDGGNGPRYANKDDIFQQELSDNFIQDLSDFINS
ncbi:hypothetical protein EhVM1_000222 [Emiliania huxleyi virus M1]|nr:hypothetical protein EhVM1_000222 [Emiliania huxleyi virus M1]